LISQTSSYAIRSLSALARQGGTPVPVGALADLASVPSPFLGKIMSLLARRKIVINRRGKRGGCVLARDPSHITLYDICIALDDPAVQSTCLLGSEPCSDDRACPAHAFWRGHQTKLIAFLMTTTIQDVARFDDAVAHARATLSFEPTAPQAMETIGGPGQVGAVTIITGPVGGGKTTYCEQVVRDAREAGKSVGGITLSIDDTPGRPSELVAIDLRTRSRCVVGRRRAAIGPIPGEVDHWGFDAVAMEWVIRTIRDACPCDVLVVDTIGPIEIEQQGVVADLLEIVDRRDFGRALVTSSPSNVDSLIDRWPNATVITLEPKLGPTLRWSPGQGC